MLLREKLNNNKKTLLSFVTFPSPEIIEVLGLTGWDGVVIDLEHGSMTRSDLANLFRAAESKNLFKMVRVPVNDPKVILGALDLGADGILVPMVNNASEAERVVAAVHYPPNGIRGFAQGRAADYGINLSPHEYSSRTKEILVGVQIESREAVENVSSIAKVEGLDLVFVGPGDLSADYDLLGNPSHETIQKIIEKIGLVAKENNKIGGIFSNNPEQLHSYADKGYTFLLANTMPMIANKLKAFKDSMN